MPKLHAHFENMFEARKALQALNKSGYTNVHLDLAGSFDYEYSNEISTAGTEGSTNLSGLVVKSGGNLLDPARTPSAAANPSYCGAESEECTRNISTRLCVNADEAEKEKISNIIKENGGRIFTTFIEYKR
jgi:hypothetical protein